AGDARSGVGGNGSSRGDSGSSGAWSSGSDRSGDRKSFWVRRKKPAGKVFRRRQRGLLKASKNLNHLIESQRSDQVKEGLGYNAVPPTAADLYLSPKKDLSWTGLPEFELETLKEEKDVVDAKLARLLKSSKDLEKLIESQRSDKVKEGVGYNAVPPPAADLYLSPKKDLSQTGLPEFADDTVTDYSRPSPTVKCTSDDGQNQISFASKNGEPTDSILSKPAVKFVKGVNRPAERPTTNKAEIVKKPTVKYAEMYRRPSKKPTVRGNQQN
nr:hypothetical protein [Tanacetum cinerariifolium]